MPNQKNQKNNKTKKTTEKNVRKNNDELEEIVWNTVPDSGHSINNKKKFDKFAQEMNVRSERKFNVMFTNGKKSLE